MIDKDGEIFVRCPLCHHEYTHQDNLIAYERENGQEDARSYAIDPVEQTKRPTSNNPSKRREAVQIGLFGECGHYFLMNIIQHKGRTLIEFEF